MSKNFSKILLVAALIYLSLPLLAMAAGLQLETTFPKAPSMQEIVTGKTQLPGIIRYVVDWSIIIAALVTVLALVVAGISYLTSRGRPEATKAAKDRIKNCIYGLLIIAGSFLVLQTINPQLTIMTIQKKPVTGGGVIMFTQAGFYGNGEVNGCTIAPIICVNPEAIFGFNATNGDTLEILIKAGAARYLNYDIANTITEFGKLTKRASGQADSANFPLYGLGFFSGATDEAEAKVFAYPDVQFNVSDEPKASTINLAIEYRSGGKMKQDGTVEKPSEAALAGSPAGELSMKLIKIYDDYATNFNSVVSYYNPLVAPAAEEKAALPHPPLSIRMQGGGPGVVLYADNGGMKNLSATVEDFNVSNVKFDNQADKIELRNLDDKGSRIHDFLAILHSGYFFTGDLRMFLEKYGLADETKNEPPLQIPLLYKNCFKELTGRASPWDIILGRGLSAILNPTDCKDSYIAGNFCTESSCTLGEPITDANGDYYYQTIQAVDYGNIPRTLTKEDPPNSGKIAMLFIKINISLHDRFGYIRPQDKASSLELFELYRKQGSYYGDSGAVYSDKVKKQGEPVCREVKLCNSKGYMGDCLVYVPNLPDYIKQRFTASGGRYDTYLLPMAPMLPVPIPWGMNGKVMTYDDKGKVIKDKKANFEDKIKSISIDGDCVVILFENAIADMEKCFECQVLSGQFVDNDNCKKCWDSGGPGANSEVFTASVADLTNHEISKCGGRERFGFGERKNCASSIAIFPIRKTNEQQGQQE